MAFQFQDPSAAIGGYSLLPSWASTGVSAMYGSGAPAVSRVPAPQSTALASTAQAIASGQQAYSQLPGYAGDISKIGSNISSEVAGKLPDDVVAQIARAGAERGVATGSPGSPNSNASYLQALGLNSLQLEQTGQQNLSSILPTLPGAAVSQNPNFYVSPALQQQAATTNANAFTEANASAAGLAAAKAGAAAAGGSTSFGPLPPTPGGSAGTPTATPQATTQYYNPPNVGWGTGPDNTNPASTTQDWLASIIGDYATTASPQSGGSNDAYDEAESYSYD